MLKWYVVKDSLKNISTYLRYGNIFPVSNEKMQNNREIVLLVAKQESSNRIMTINPNYEFYFKTNKCF